MKKFVKIAAIVVAVVLVIALVAPMVLRGKIAEIVKREANAMLDARLDFEKLDISLLRHFPRASLDLKGLTLVGEEPFGGDTIVAAQRISVVVNVMSLFGDEGFEVTKIILSEPALHAHKLADGRVNWDVVKASEEAQVEYRLQLGGVLLRHLRPTDLLQSEHGKHQRFILIGQIFKRYTLESQFATVEQINCPGIAVGIKHIVHRYLGRQSQYIQCVHTRRNNSGFALPSYLFSDFIDGRVLYAHSKLSIDFGIAIEAPCNTDQTAFSSKPFQCLPNRYSRSVYSEIGCGIQLTPSALLYLIKYLILYCLHLFTHIYLS